MQRFVFHRPDAILVAVMGGILIAGSLAGLIAALVIGKNFDYATSASILLCVAIVCAVGYGMINAWRHPLLTVTPEALIVPTFFGTRTIPITPGHPVGELLATPSRSRRPGGHEANKFVHFFTLDARGKLVELLALHRDAPEIPQIRRALREVGGLSVETLSVDQRAGPARPDISHWPGRS